MRASDIIAKCDSIKPNEYTFEFKMEQIYKLETEIRTYMSLHTTTKADMSFKTQSNPILALPDEESDIYVYYIISMIDLANQEYQLYNNSVTFFNSLYDRWQKKYRRSHKPLCTVISKL